MAVVVVQRVDEQKKWDRVQADRRENYRNLERGQRQQWGELYRRHELERRELSQDWGSIKGRVRQWRAQGKHWDELIPADERQSPGTNPMGSGAGVRSNGASGPS